jgi:murein DD-endopeptidase MepM/ murein hydrolase activator NlpD
VKRSIALALSCACLAITAMAQGEGLYKYKDAQGNWVFTDRKPDGASDVEQLPLADNDSVPEITVTRRPSDEGVALIANNNCFCPAEVAVRLLMPEGHETEEPQGVRRVLPARRETVLMQLSSQDPQLAAVVGYEYRAVLGEPLVKHDDSQIYRAPFALARTFRVTQAYPATFTHGDAGNRHAVDVEMPVGTQIYAARAGTVIEVASRNFEGGASTKNLTKANIVRVLHADGTMALYGHLNWDSIRVRPGQIVKRGQYIADSGNTGFTTGPHLHFVVQRNAGLQLESLPVVFAGPAGKTVTPATGDSLTAY